jgi:hypothetical protein
MLVRAKGTPAHKRRGRIYMVLILATSGTALGIYRLGVFFFPHWFAIASLLTTTLGFAAAHWKIPRIGWVHLHPDLHADQRLNPGRRRGERGFPAGVCAAPVGAEPELARCRADASGGHGLVRGADRLFQRQGMAARCRRCDHHACRVALTYPEAA